MAGVTMAEAPVVHLVGSGPGDPELLTVRAWKLLQRADVVVHDRLIGRSILDLAPAAALKIDVGKKPGEHRFDQSSINALLAELAAPGRVVVRLKGGDPFVFGRGGEEALYLLRRGIGVEVVPGITAAFGCAAANRVPLTHRGVATGVRFVTGHCRDGWWLELDWNSLADPATTLVIYMGLTHIEHISGKLIRAGLDAATPTMAIENGTQETERNLRAPLGSLAEACREAGFRSPVLFIIGPVVEVLHNPAPVPLTPPDRHAAWIERVLHA